MTNVEYLFHIARRAIKSDDPELVAAGESLLSFCVVHLKATNVLIPTELLPHYTLVQEYMAVAA